MAKVFSKGGKSPRSLLGGLKAAATSKRSTGSTESKLPSSSPKAGPKESGVHQLKADNLLVSGGRRKAAAAIGDVAREEVDGGAASLQDNSLPVKALVYTDTFQSGPVTGDIDDDALSSATGTTVKGRGSPCSIADLSSLEPTGSPMLGARDRALEPAHSQSRRIGEQGTYVLYCFKALCPGFLLISQEQIACALSSIYIYIHAL